MRRSLKRIRCVLLMSCLGLVVIATSGILLARILILHAAKDRTFVDVQSLPANRVGLVLGCSRVLSNGRLNLFFRYRMQAAWEAYREGKVTYLIVSGDNHIKTYDEPTDMKAALVELGVPADRIYCDYAGFRTLDSVVRAKEVFGVQKLTVISQAFHNQRAIYIGCKHEMDVVGYNARDVNPYSGFKTRCREHLARVKAVIDVAIIKRRPKFLGKPIVIGESHG